MYHWHVKQVKISILIKNQEIILKLCNNLFNSWIEIRIIIKFLLDMKIYQINEFLRYKIIKYWNKIYHLPIMKQIIRIFCAKI
jgi:hypothetical protein